MVTYGVTGATGQVGGAVAQALARHGVAQRLVVRDPRRAPSLPGAEVAVAAYGDGEAAYRALAGVDVLLLVSAGEAPDRRAQHRSVVAAAAAAGVGQVVYTSFVGASPDATFTLARDHADTEAALREAPLEATVLRDNLYADLLPAFADASGVIRGPAGTGRVAAVGRADVVDCAVAVLLDPAPHRGAVYDLSGPEAVTLADLARRAAAALGRPLRFVDETIEEAYASRARLGAERWQLDAWVSTYTAIARDELAGVSDDVLRLTGRPPRTLEEVWAGS